MLKLTNINYQMVVEMAEGDKEFETELLDAIINSVKDLRKKYSEGIMMQSDDIIIQARHKIKPTLSLFGLDKISTVIEEGKSILNDSGMTGPETDRHKAEFFEAVDDLLDELNHIDN
jgi:hypothetical protein